MVSKEFQNRRDYIFELYKLAADTRKFEIDNFWKRALFFWGALAIILVGYFQIEKSYHEYLVFISFLGFVYTFIFSLSVRGSKFWQENWKKKVIHYQDKLKKLYPTEFDSDFDVFGIPIHLEIQNKESKHYLFHRSYRFSVSKLVLILSDITLLLMFLLFGKDVVNLFSSISWKLFDNNYKIHYVAIIFILVFAISVYYFYQFIRGEVIRNERLFRIQERKNSKRWRTD